MSPTSPTDFHLHLISDATGETLSTMSRAASVQYPSIKPIEHVYALVRNEDQLKAALKEIKKHPGIVLHTIVNRDLVQILNEFCKKLDIPSVAVLDPLLRVFATHLNIKSAPTVGAQHSLNAEYFHRMDALNFALLHDDGLLPHDLDEADIILVGISRTSKTPTSMYLANRGLKTANIPLVPNIPLPDSLKEKTSAFIVGLISSPNRIAQIRRNRVRELADRDMDEYVDRASIQEELKYARRICAQHEWPIIDVTRRSIEETSAAILKLYQDYKGKGA